MLMNNLENAKRRFYLWLMLTFFICRYENILDHVDKKKHIFIHKNFINSKHKTKYANVHYFTEGVNVELFINFVLQK